MSTDHVRKQDELHDCLRYSITIADLLINVGDVPEETIPTVGTMLSISLRRANELNQDLWKALQAST